MAEAVYILCALTSLVCAGLLLRSWWHGRHKLLLWSALCFVGLMLNNAFLVADRLLAPSVDLTVIMKIPAVIGLAIFLFGLIWESK